MLPSAVLVPPQQGSYGRGNSPLQHTSAAAKICHNLLRQAKRFNDCVRGSSLLSFLPEVRWLAWPGPVFDGKFCAGIDVRLAENYADVSRDEPLARAAPGLQEPALASIRQTIMARVGMAPHHLNPQWAITHLERKLTKDNSSFRPSTHTSGTAAGSPCKHLQRPGSYCAAARVPRPRHAAMPGSSSRAWQAEQELRNVRDPTYLQNCTLRGAGAGEGLERTGRSFCFCSSQVSQEQESKPSS